MPSGILKFDHISKVVQRGCVPEPHYKFCELGIKNTDGRYGFMDYPYPDIDMFFYDGFDGGLPVEVVAYDRAKNNSSVNVVGNRITCHVDTELYKEVENIFELIGFKKEARYLWDVSGYLDRRKVYFDLKPEYGINPLPINMGGYNCPCFLMKSVRSLFQNIGEDNQVVLSSIDPLIVNKRVLDVGFLTVQGFEMAFEFISLHRD